MRGPTWGEHWLQEHMVPTVLTTRREEAMEKGERVLVKLGNENHGQDALRGPINEWLSESIIRVLPKDVKDKLWAWSLQNHSHWQIFIAQADEDLTEYDEVICSRQIRARFESCRLGRYLDHGRCLVHILEDALLRACMERLVFRMREAEANMFPANANPSNMVEVLITGLKSKLSPMQPLTQRPQNPLSAGPRDEHDRSALVRIMQQVFDASILATPNCPALVDVWMVLLPMMDYALLPSICFDTEKAKQRWALAKKHPWRRVVDEEMFSMMAAMINKTDPESLLVAYMGFLIYMPQILNEKDSALLERCLQRPEADRKVVPGGRKRPHSESEE
ncbi:hypothetical protein N0V84_004007 [Fusarium piperis]|uniref:Uncharacterized protein n=1 Tax=Fusarium piperis TaxID=1435070 RepID=A0A9W8WGF5_9HYPO|nr:hypothetical protein N0V84_004007 [Fusarium piperis]